MKNLPTKIYLQIGEDNENEEFIDLNEVTWCKDRIFDNDVCYVLQKENK